MKETTKMNTLHQTPSPADAAELRRRAEDRLQTRERNPQSAQGLVHELQVHQIELEVQNEELVQARAKADALLAQYTNLYEFAPTGYFNLARDGTILAVNLTGARLLGRERAQLVNRRLGFLVSEADRERLIQELQAALARVKLLSGLLPICAGCKQIRDDRGYWSQVESYLQKHSEATFTHGLCPDCIQKYYPELDITAPGSALTQRKKPRGEEATAPAPPR